MDFLPRINCINKIFVSIGETWVELIKNILDSGVSRDEYLELNNVILNFRSEDVDDIIEKYGNKLNITEMKKVFFSDDENIFGHSYCKLMNGPKGRNDLFDVADILKEKNASNRAVISFSSIPEKQPCISAIQFKIRDGILNTSYFSRGQDIYNKFYCDAICIDHITKIICDELHIDDYVITGFISSAHIYKSDIMKASNLVECLNK